MAVTSEKLASLQEKCLVFGSAGSILHASKWAIEIYKVENCPASIVAAADLSEEQLSESRDVFSYFDSKGDERIAIHQVGDVLRALGQNPTDAEVKKCCAHWTNAETRITFEEFLPMYQTVHKNRETHTQEEFVEGLSHFDKEGNGFINVAELRHLLTTLGERLADEEVDQLLSGQEDSNGNINIGDFVRHVITD